MYIYIHCIHSIQAYVCTHLRYTCLPTCYLLASTYLPVYPPAHPPTDRPTCRWEWALFCMHMSTPLQPFTYVEVHTDTIRAHIYERLYPTPARLNSRRKGEQLHTN